MEAKNVQNKKELDKFIVREIIFCFLSKSYV